MLRGDEHPGQRTSANSIPFPQDGSERPQSFCFRRASGSGRWGRRQQCSSRQRIGALGCAQRAGARVPFEIARGLSQKLWQNPRRDQARAQKLSKEHTPYKPDLTDAIQVSQPGRQCRLRVSCLDALRACGTLLRVTKYLSLTKTKKNT